MTGKTTEDIIANAVDAATDKHFVDTSAAAGLEDEVPPTTTPGGEDSGTQDVAGAEAPGQVEETPGQVAAEGDAEVVAEESGEEEVQAGGETDPEGVTEPPEEVAEDLTPRDVDGQYVERFSRINPNDLAPELVPAYRSMQADYTRKTMELAEEKGQLREVESQYNELEAQLSTPQGISDFLVRTGLYSPEAFRNATERIEAIGSDDRERELYAREEAIQQRERSQRTETRKAQVEHTESMVTEAVARMQALEDELDIPFATTEQFVAAQIESIRLTKGVVTSADVARVIEEFAAPIRERQPRNKKATVRAQKAQTYVKEKAAQAAAKSVVTAGPAAPQPKPAEEMPVGDPEKMFDRLFEKHAGALYPN